MPRLTFRQYCDLRKNLSEAWHILDGEPYGRLSPRDQRALHTFFRPSEDDLTEAQLRAHRRDVTMQDPSLPHRAGRAYRKMERGEMWKDAPTHITRSGGTVRVVGTMRPDPDLNLLAKAIIMIELRIMREELQAAKEKAKEVKRQESRNVSGKPATRCCCSSWTGRCSTSS